MVHDVWYMIYDIKFAAGTGPLGPGTQGPGPRRILCHISHTIHHIPYAIYRTISFHSFVIYSSYSYFYILIHTRIYIYLYTYLYSNNTPYIHFRPPYEYA